MSRAADHRPALPTLALNMTPMIDVVFLLLTYFILASQFRAVERTTPAPIAPRAGALRALDPFELPLRPVVLGVRSHGDGAREFSLGSDDPALELSGALAGVVERLHAALRDGRLSPDRPFIIRPEPAARWEHAVEVFHAARDAGLTTVRLAPPGAQPGTGVGALPGGLP